MQDVAEAKEAEKREALEESIAAQRAHRETLLTLLDALSPACIAPVCSHPASTYPPSEPGTPLICTPSRAGGSDVASGWTEPLAPRSELEPEDYPTPLDTDASSIGRDLDAIDALITHPPSASTADALAEMQRHPLTLAQAPFQALRMRLASCIAVPQTAAAAVLSRLSHFTARSVALAEEARAADCAWRERIAGAHSEARRLEAAHSAEKATATAATARCKERDAEASVARADLAATAANAAELARMLAAQEAEVLRLHASARRRRPPLSSATLTCAANALQDSEADSEAAYEALQLHVRQLETQAERDREAILALEVQLELAAEKAAMLHERNKDLSEDAAAQSDAAMDALGQLEVKDCRIAELRRALGEARDAAERKAAAASAASLDASLAVVSVGVS
jgi:hypothetical protein